MTRTKLYAALLLSFATPAAFAQQAEESSPQDTSKDTCRIVESAEPDAGGVYRAVLECTRPATATTPATTLVVGNANGGEAHKGGAPSDTDGISYFSSNGVGDGTDDSVAGYGSVAVGPGASALGPEAIAMGWGANAEGEWTVAIGRAI